MRSDSVRLLALLAAVSLGVYLLASHLGYGTGFPLDDAWIHQTYARNLAAFGEWSFIPGSPSAGSTAPLWSLLLALGYFLGLDPLFWSGLLGWGILSGIAVIGCRAMQVFAPQRPAWALVAGLLMLFEWHLVWAAASGMETLLFALLVTVVLVSIVSGGKHWFWIGLVIGLAVWVRPDGMTLLGPLALSAFFRERSWRGRFLAWFWIGAGCLLLFLPYLAFNASLAGELWPNTLFAKQAEYAVLQQIFLGRRLLELGLLPLVGVGSVLLPGVLLVAARAWSDRSWPVLAGFAWWIGYLGIYAWRLPVTYQHGRYLIPAMPIFFLWGLAGMAYWVTPRARSMWRRVASRVWQGAAILVGLIFWLQGAVVFSRDVAFINAGMVDTARWIAGHTEPDALIAAHDIGALGYFGERAILDMAGLVSPEVIPIIRNEAELSRLLDVRRARYLMTLEGWYPLLESQLQPVYRENHPILETLGGAAMIVYRWLPP